MRSNIRPQYRPDIDGLRAIAVLSVVGFHASSRLVPGGFVGVDVFFVISGYLISSVILKSLDKGSFSFADFYARRIRRIFPALILVLLAVWILGWLFLFPHEHMNIGKHIVGGAFFFSNVLLWKDSGYFASSAELKPLLHLWSLSIEEQFYAIWPLTVVLAWKWRSGKSLPWVILFLAVCSFLLEILGTSISPVATFCLAPTRFWELLIGSALAYFSIFSKEPFDKVAPGLSSYPQAGTILRNAGATVGLLLLIGAVGGLDKESAFPGWWALLPTIGTLLLLLAGQRAWINRKLLGNRLLVSIGLISYPLYLWHWPLLSFARIVESGSPSRGIKLAVVLLSSLLAWLTYRYVEKPIRFQHTYKKSVAVFLSMGIVCAALLGFSSNQSFIMGRLDNKETRKISNAISDWTYPGGRGKPYVVGRGTPKVVFIGDSHMEQYWPRAQVVSAKDKSKSSLFMTIGGCPPLPSINRLGNRGFSCHRFFDDALQIASEPDVETVVFSGAWGAYFFGGLDASYEPLLYDVRDRARKPIRIDGIEADRIFDEFREVIYALRRKGKTVYIILSSPISKQFDPVQFFPNRIDKSQPFRQAYIFRADFTKHIEPVARRLKIISMDAGAKLIDPTDYLCGPLLCNTTDKNGDPIYMDANHLRPEFAAENAKFIDEILAN